MYWTVCMQIDVPEYIGAGDFRRRIPQNWKDIIATVRLAKEHHRDGWMIEDEFVPPSNDDVQSGAPFGRPENILIELAACRWVVQHHGTDILKCYLCTAHADPEPVVETAPEPIETLDLSKPLPRDVLNTLRWFSLKKHVKLVAGADPKDKAEALGILEDLKLIAA